MLSTVSNPKSNWTDALPEATETSTCRVSQEVWGTGGSVTWDTKTGPEPKSTETFMKSKKAASVSRQVAKWSHTEGPALERSNVGEVRLARCAPEKPPTSRS